MSKEEFSGSRRRFIKNTLTAGAAMQLSSLEKVTRVFENTEFDPEQNKIKDFLSLYDRKYPEMKDKFAEQKQWFLDYMDSLVYRKQFKKEILNIQWGNTRPSNAEIESIIDNEIQKRKSVVENVVFMFDNNPQNKGMIYASVKTGNEMSSGSLGVVDGVVKPSDLDKKYHVIVFNKQKYESNPKHRFWNNTMFAHELHHLSLRGSYLKQTDAFFKKSLTGVDFNQEVASKYSVDTEEMLKPKENMAAIIEVRKMLSDLGKLDGFNDEFTKEHIYYVKQYLKDLFPEDVAGVHFLFGNSYTNKEIPEDTLLDIMNSFAGTVNPEELNSRMS